MKKVLQLTCFVAFLLMSANIFAQGSKIVGKWKTIDDKTGEAKSVVEISEKGGKYYGTVTELLSRTDDPVCEKCKGAKKSQKINGLEIVWGMKEKGDGLEGGKILDPENGKEYRCKMWLEGKNLKVRGYVSFLYRTQTWYKVD